MNNNPLWNSLAAKLSYLVVWAIIIASQIAYFGTISSPLIICGTQALLLLLIWFPVRYYQNVLNIPLFLLFHLILLAFIVGISFGVDYWTTSNSNHYPTQMAFSVLLYVIAVQFYYLALSKTVEKEQIKEREEWQSESTEKPQEKLSSLSVKKNKEIQFISIDEIIYIEANGDYVLIHTHQGRYIKDRTMKYWEMHLPEESFVRVHRSFIVNMAQVSKLELYEKDTYRLKLKNEAMLKVSQSGYKLLKQRMH